MKIQLDPEINALYLSLESGEVARTIEVGNSIYVDIDDAGEILGVEFANAYKLLPFLRDARTLSTGDGSADLPARTCYQLRALFSPTAP